MTNRIINLLVSFILGTIFVFAAAFYLDFTNNLFDLTNLNYGQFIGIYFIIIFIVGKIKIQFQNADSLLEKIKEEKNKPSDKELKNTLFMFFYRSLFLLIITGLTYLAYFIHSLFI